MASLLDEIKKRRETIDSAVAAPEPMKQDPKVQQQAVDQYETRRESPASALTKTFSDGSVRDWNEADQEWVKRK